nr:zinc finger, CCHC-type [Tanacetum cinerariifolium]
MASMNTRLNIKKLDGNIVQKHRGSKQVGSKQLGPGVETGVHKVHDEKRVWFKVELQGPQGDRKAEAFQVSNDDTAVAQRRLEDKQLKEKTNTDCLVKEQEKEYQTWWKIKTGNVLYSCNQRSTYLVNMSPSSAIGFKKPIDMLGVFGWLASIKQVEKIYAHESLTFHNTVACEVISKWKAVLKDDMNARTDVYVLSCRKCSDNNDGYYWEYTPAKGNVLGLEIVKDQSGNYDVEKNGKWSYTFVVGSHEYQVVCTRPNIASAGVDMLDGFDRGLQTNVHVFVDFDYNMRRSIIVMSRSITRYGLMILSEVPAQVEVVAYHY